MIGSIKDWIINNLSSGERENKCFDSSEIKAFWNPVQAEDNCTYDGYIEYSKNHKCIKVYFSEEALSDSINFSKHSNTASWDKEKLQVLINDIKNKTEGGHFKIELMSHRGAITKIHYCGK